MTGHTISHYRILEKFGVGFPGGVFCVVGFHSEYPNQAMAGGLGARSRGTLPEPSEAALKRSGIRGEWISETATRVRQGNVP